MKQTSSGTPALRRRCVPRPLFRQIQPIGGRQARVVIGDRKRYRHLTIVLLAEFPQYCRPTPTQRRPGLGKPVSSMIHASIGPCRSIPGSTISRTFAKTCSSDQPPHQQNATAIGVGRGPFRRRNRSCRLHTLALARNHQPHAIIPKRFDPVRVSDHAPQTLHIRRKPDSLHYLRRPEPSQPPHADSWNLGK